MLFRNVVLAYSVISFEFANESVAKFSVNFSTVSIKGVTISRIFFYISLLAGMNRSSCVIFLDMNYL